METPEEISKHLGANVRSMIPSGAKVLIDNQGETLSGFFVGVMQDERGSWSIIVRHTGMVALTSWHPSRVSLAYSWRSVVSGWQCSLCEEIRREPYTLPHVHKYLPTR